MYIAFAIAGFIALVALLFVVWLAATVDDWSRDLTTNQAATSAEAKRPSLHPIHSERPPRELADMVVVAANQLAGWEIVEREESDKETRLHLVRTTRLLRFKDDIRVNIRPLENAQPIGSEITAQSSSRIGKADFGQNPRNLGELMDRIRSLLR
jgi:uncharacterized protein (DUF1499 family)